MVSGLIARLSHRNGIIAEGYDRELSSFIYLYALCGHTAFILVFLLLGNAFVLTNNFVCIGTDLLCLYLNRKGKINLSQILFILAVLYHSSCCILVYGWEPGFYLYPFSLTTLLFLSRNSLPVKFIVSSLLFFAVAYFYLKIPDLGTWKIHLTGSPLVFMFFSNIISVFFALCYLANFHVVFVAQAEKELLHLAMHDRLSGLLNRHAIVERLKAEIKRSSRKSGSFSILMVDIDFFKHINDTYGHIAGDKVIIAVAQELSGTLRVYDSMGRYGGEEFLGILPDCDLQSSLSIAERLRTNVQNRVVHHEGQGLCVTISIGVASIFKTNDEMVEDLIAHADEALYRAKHNGRNCVVHF